MVTMAKGGVYAYRCLKPGARLRIPALSWHWCYVGETTSFYHRDQQHRFGLGQYGGVAKDWADLSPYVALRIPLPPWKWLLRSVETLVILALWPVYNVSKNRWNPRRIRPGTARMQRRQRDLGLPVINLRSGTVALIVLGCAVAAWYWIGSRA
ncbi:MAG: hypothetical protein ACJ72N_27500 [Labedaea sp.]